MFILGALLSRLHGSTIFPYKIVKSLLWALPFAICIHIFMGWWSIAVLLLCALGKSTGHGNFIDLGNYKLNSEDERLEFIIKWLKPRVSNYYYDCIGLSLTGIAASLGFVIAIAFVNPVYAFVAFLGAGVKPLGYMVGWKVKPNKATEVGEFASGTLAYLILDVIFLYNL